MGRVCEGAGGWIGGDIEERHGARIELRLRASFGRVRCCGLDGVLHDLSRGCSADDIVNVAVITSLQAGD